MTTLKILSYITTNSTVHLFFVFGDFFFNLLLLGGVHKLRLQDEVGRLLSKCQQMSTGVGRWSGLCQRWLFFNFFNVQSSNCLYNYPQESFLSLLIFLGYKCFQFSLKFQVGSTCLVIGVKLGTYQYRGKNYHVSTLTGIVVGRW